MEVSHEIEKIMDSYWCKEIILDSPKEGVVVATGSVGIAAFCSVIKGTSR